MTDMGTTNITTTPYDTDFAEWADQTAALLRAGHLDALDLEHVAEEIEGLAIANRRAVESQMVRLMKHVVKQKIQPERDAASWQVSIVNARYEIKRDVKSSPSLHRHLGETLEELYQQAAEEALLEAGFVDAKDHKRRRSGLPAVCPWTVDELLEGERAELGDKL